MADIPEETKPTLVCSECGSDEVEYLDWIDANSGKITNTYQGHGEENWCRNCESHPRLITEEEYEANGRT